MEEDERAEEWRVDAEEILLISAHNSHNLVRSLALVSVAMCGLLMALNC